MIIISVSCDASLSLSLTRILIHFILNQLIKHTHNNVIAYSEVVSFHLNRSWTHRKIRAFQCDLCQISYRFRINPNFFLYRHFRRTKTMKNDWLWRHFAPGIPFTAHNHILSMPFNDDLLFSLVQQKMYIYRSMWMHAYQAVPSFPPACDRAPFFILSDNVCAPVSMSIEIKNCYKISLSI